MNTAKENTDKPSCAYLTPAGAWALAFGCAVGWGAFVMPGNTFLPIAGPVGTALGLGLGAVYAEGLGKRVPQLRHKERLGAEARYARLARLSLDLAPVVSGEDDYGRVVVDDLADLAHGFDAV